MSDLTGMAGHDDLVSTSSSASGPDRPKRRAFTAEYKLAILEEYEQADSQGRGALLRRERLLTSHISEWRKARKGGALKALEPRTRKPSKSAVQVEVEKLRKEKDKLARELATTKAALEIVGKAHALLEMLSKGADSEPKPEK
jgi:transposase-like protein